MNTQSGEGDQALLDVRFPNVTLKGEGCHIASYTSNDGPYRKLTLWHLLHENKNSRGPVSPANTPSSNTQNTTTVPRSLKQHAVDTISVSSKNYQQTYCILKSAWEGYASTSTYLSCIVLSIIRHLPLLLHL